VVIRVVANGQDVSHLEQWRDVGLTDLVFNHCRRAVLEVDLEPELPVAEATAGVVCAFALGHDRLSLGPLAQQFLAVSWQSHRRRKSTFACPGTEAILAEEPFFALNRVSKGGRAPAFFWVPSRDTFGGNDLMDRELEQIQSTVEDRLRNEEPDVELLSLERPAAERLLLVIDRPEGVDIALCERVTALLRDLLESYSLEVSSPGPERPLTKPEHFRRYLGRRVRVRVRTRDEVAGHKSFTGRLTGADEESVSVDSGDGPVSIPLAAVRRSNLLPNVNGGVS
jgi:ribosome maturation factor RimP